jgi:hypothetical protein
MDEIRAANSIPNRKDSDAGTVDPRLKVIEGRTIVDAKGGLIFDVYEFLSNRDPDNELILATPNIPEAKLQPLRQAFIKDANGENLDLSILILGRLKGNDDDEVTNRWELGWSDGEHVFVYVYPKEFFDSKKNARIVFEKKIVPSHRST